MLYQVQIRLHLILGHSEPFKNRNGLSETEFEQQLNDENEAHRALKVAHRAIQLAAQEVSIKPVMQSTIEHKVKKNHADAFATLELAKHISGAAEAKGKLASLGWQVESSKRTPNLHIGLLNWVEHVRVMLTKSSSDLEQSGQDSLPNKRKHGAEGIEGCNTTVDLCSGRFTSDAKPQVSL